MPFEVGNLPEAIGKVKRDLRAALPNYAEIFRDVESEMRCKVAQIVKEQDAGEPVIPTVHYSEIAGGGVSPQMTAKIKDRGACVIRNVFAPEQACAWNEEIGRYVEENHLDEKLAHAAEDKYFGNLGMSKPQIYGIYWSRPQVQARQAESLTQARIFMNRLWRAESEGRRSFRSRADAGVRRSHPAAAARIYLPRHFAALRWRIGGALARRQFPRCLPPRLLGKLARL